MGIASHLITDINYTLVGLCLYASCAEERLRKNVETFLSVTVTMFMSPVITKIFLVLVLNDVLFFGEYLVIRNTQCPIK